VAACATCAHTRTWPDDATGRYCIACLLRRIAAQVQAGAEVTVATDSKEPQ